MCIKIIIRKNLSFRKTNTDIESTKHKFCHSQKNLFCKSAKLLFTYRYIY